MRPRCRKGRRPMKLPIPIAKQRSSPPIAPTTYSLILSCSRSSSVKSVHLSFSLCLSVPLSVCLSLSLSVPLSLSPLSFSRPHSHLCTSRQAKLFSLAGQRLEAIIATLPKQKVWLSLPLISPDLVGRSSSRPCQSGKPVSLSDTDTDTARSICAKEEQKPPLKR
jgi:hypothetical protein